MKEPTRKSRIIRLILSVAAVLLLILSSSCAPGSKQAKTDDWRAPSAGQSVPTTPTNPATPTAPPPVPSAPAMERPQREAVRPTIPTAPTTPASPSVQGGGTIGLAAGGAKDINNFRENIKKGYLPLPTDVTYEGLFYDYFFETGRPEETDKLFSPSYSYAITADPFSGETDYYLSVGLNSGMKERDFQRKKLNMVIVLDISGSMSSSFDSYYYDQFGKRANPSGEDFGKSKIQVATESVVALLGHLSDDDRFGMVVFNGSARLVKPLSLVGRSDMDTIKYHILELFADGSTNLDAGIQMATDLYDELGRANPSQYENRIIFLTDAMPNQGDTSERGLLGMVKRNAANRIYTTFIGIGVDFNTELVDYITKIKGANYYSVHSPREFRSRMYDEFDFMVTPLVFDLELSLKAVGWQIEKVYGSPEADQATGRLMKVNTLFPSEKQGGETKGGIILLKLRKTGPNGSLRLTASYEDRNGNQDSSESIVRIRENDTEYFQNDGIRKGVLLARYADLLKNWMIDEREHVRVSTYWEPRVDYYRKGIIVPPTLGQWERQSMPLRVSGPYPRLFGEFLSYFRGEMEALNDETLDQESDILRELSGIRMPEPRYRR
ncbi:MAG: VWA domain-containing protein [Chloroflexi bacterium]|nr:VWA domain-containing protein [Chloroflexota bacterium]